MEDESIQKDEEKLKSLLETLKKNDENVPKELLKTKYKKPYRELKDSIKEVADQISGRRIRQDIVIKNDDAGQVLIKQIQEMLEEKRRAGTGKELGRTLYKEYSVEKFLQVVEEIRIAGETYVDVRALCTENGVDGNELLPGQVNVLVDLIPYVESVSNTTKTSGGADLESDESLAERIFLAPSGYSVAGPDDAYKYWTKTYSQTIGDVKVTSPNPVEVEIRFIMTDGELPTKTVIDGVAAYLQDENIRPLTDKVTVLAPETVKFNIAFTYYVNLSDQSKAGTIQAEVAQAVADYIEWQTRTIGRDINPSELMKRIVAAGAKRAEITSPVFTTVPDTSVARIGTQTVTYGGVEND